MDKHGHLEIETFCQKIKSFHFLIYHVQTHGNVTFRNNKDEYMFAEIICKAKFHSRSSRKIVVGGMYQIQICICLL